MKKLLLLLLICSILIPNIVKSQVAKIENELISNDQIILIGPLNVDTYFPEQSNIYISKYEKIVEELQSLMDTFKSELEYLENKRITNKFKFGQIEKVIEKITLELEMLNDFILLWEEHDLNFNSFNDFLRENSNEINCCSFIIGGDTLKNEEIKIIEVSPQEQVEYYEFIEGDYLEMVNVFSKQNYDKRIHNSKCIIRVEGEPREFVVCASGYRTRTSNILDQIEKKRNFQGILDGKLETNKILEEDDPIVIRKIERLFSKFRFDKYEKEFSKERKFKDVDAFFQILINEEDRQIIPEKVFLTECD